MTAFCSQESSQSNIIASSTVCDVTGPFKALRNPRSGNDSLRLRDKTIEAFNPWQSGMIPLLRSLGSVDPVGVTVLPTPITSRLMARRARFLVSSKICHSSRVRTDQSLDKHGRYDLYLFYLGSPNSMLCYSIYIVEIPIIFSRSVSSSLS